MTHHRAGRFQLGVLTLRVFGHLSRMTTLFRCVYVLPQSEIVRKGYGPLSHLACLGPQLAAGVYKEFRILPSLVIFRLLQPHPRLDYRFLGGGRNLASQVRLGLALKSLVCREGSW